MTTLKTPIRYFGGKTNLAERIVALMPDHDGYIEPFAGSLAVLLAKPGKKIEVVNDIDGRLMTFWRVLRDRPLDLARVAHLTPHSRAELELAMAFETGLDELETARRVWVLLTQGRTGTLRRTGWRFFADTTGTSSSFAQYMDAYRDRLLPAAERLRAVTLEQRDAIDVIEQYGQFERNLLYVDPPYMSTTRQGGRYAFEMTSHREHERMLDALLDVRAAVMLSGYATDLYNRRLASWERVELAASSGNAKSSDRIDVIWMNRPIANALDIFGGAA
jgi:DNA adenine methylase